MKHWVLFGVNQHGCKLYFAIVDGIGVWTDDVTRARKFDSFKSAAGWKRAHLLKHAKCERIVVEYSRIGR